MRNAFMTTNCFSPEYYDKFNCIASACTDSCCRSGWEIPLDDETFEFYKGFKGLEIEKNVEDGTDGDRIFKLKPNKECVYLDDNGLCRLHIATGGRLGEICDKYPRFFEEFDGFCESGISVSCPEARRIVLAASKSDYDTVCMGGDCSDDELLNYLIDARRTAFDIVFGSKTSEEAAERLLVFGALLQDGIDFGDLIAVDESELNSFTPSGSKPLIELCRFILDETEILYDDWKNSLLSFVEGKNSVADVSEDKKKSYLAYLIYRFFLKAINREDIFSVCELIYMAFALSTELSIGFDKAVGLFAKEIEHDCVNFDMILDWIQDNPIEIVENGLK